MNWNTFKTTLKQYNTYQLQFEFAENHRIQPSFHITEIKQANITSVDCGGKMSNWTEVIMQLWEPKTATLDTMKVEKALSIIDLVEQTLLLNTNSPVKIEFGNDTFDTRQMHPHDFVINGNDIIIKLAADKTQCKAIDRGESCGTPEPKLKIAEIENGCCSTESNCC